MSEHNKTPRGKPTQFVTFYANNFLFGIDVQKVQEIIRYQEVTPVPLSSPTVKGLINLRGQILTAIDLRRRLGFTDRTKDDLPMNVVVRTEEGAASLLVDKIGDVVEVDNQQFEDTPTTIKGALRDMVSGVHKLEKKLLLVLNIDRAIDTSFNARG